MEAASWRVAWCGASFPRARVLTIWLRHQQQQSSDTDVDEELARIQAPVYVFWGAFLNSIAMIVVTELGDKTFFIAAILAMQHDRCVVMWWVPATGCR